MIGTPFNFRTNPKEDMSLKIHKLKRPIGKYMSAFDKAQKQDEHIISESVMKVQEVESDDVDSNFECCNKSDGKLVNVVVEKGTTGKSGRDRMLTLLLNNLEKKEINNKGETWVGKDSRHSQNGFTSVLRSKTKLKPLEWLGSKSYFCKKFTYEKSSISSLKRETETQKNDDGGNHLRI